MSNRFPISVRWPGHRADNSLPSVLRLKRSGTIPPLPHIPSWCAEKLYYFYIIFILEHILNFCISSINLQNARKLCCIHASIPQALVAVTSSTNMYQCTIKGIYLNYMQFSVINTTSVAKVWTSQSVSVGTNAIN